MSGEEVMELFEDWRPFPFGSVLGWFSTAVVMSVLALGVLLFGQPNLHRAYLLYAWAASVAVPFVTGTVAWLLRPRLEPPGGLIPLLMLYGALQSYCWFRFLDGSILHSLGIGIILGVATWWSERSRLTRAR